MKRLILCFDGTWNTADNGGAPTNVVRLARMIPPTAVDGTRQVVFYDQGVGTGNIVDKIAGGALGEGLEDHVKAGYLFLSQNFEPGDEIYIYGFSRGAFSARSLGGFIGASRGLLQREKLYELEKAWTYYRTPPEERNSFLLHNDIEAYVRKNIKIKVMGVWDTVGSLGIPTDIFNTFNRQRYAFHDTALSGIVEHAFQALAIDEKRGPFEATLWVQPKKPIADQIVEQVWFPGVHSDIGGGYDNSELSDLTLRWMMARTSAHTKLEFDANKTAYFLPEIASQEFFDKAGTTKQAAVHRMEEKWKGALHDSLGLYAASRVSPRIRVIGDQKPNMGTGPIRSVFRTSSIKNPKGFCEAIHWSAVRRFNNAAKESLPKYNPPNLRVALDDLKTIEMPAEFKPGLPWVKAG